MSNVVTWIVKAVDQFSATYSKMNQAIETGEQKISSFNKRLNQVNDTAKSLALRVSTPIAAFGAFGIKEFLNEKKAFDSLIHTLDNLGAKAPLTFKQITDAANAIELKSIYQTDDIVNDVTHRLVRLGTVAPINLLKAQSTIVDFASKFNMGLEGATNVFSRALQDPVSGIRVFEQRLGKLDPKMKKFIESLVDSGQVAKAQAELLNYAASKVGGAAEADKLNHPFIIMTEAISRVATEFGRELLPGFQEFVIILKDLSYKFAALSPETKRFITWTAIVIALLPIAAIALVGLVVGIKALGVAFLFLKGPVGLTIIGLTLVGAWLVKVYKAGGPFTGFIDRATTGAINLAYAIGDVIKALGSLFTMQGRANIGEQFSTGFAPNFKEKFQEISFLGGRGNILSPSTAAAGATAIDFNINVNDPNHIVKSTNLKSEGTPVNVGKNMGMQ
jgi:nitrate reductase NapE component